jgi:hypothetical protein
VAAALASEGSPEARPPGIAAVPARADALAKTQAFRDWLTAWRRADASAQSDLAAGGVELARARRTALKHLIQTDPRLALELAVPVGLRAELPAAVRAQLETRLDARGDFDVIVGCDHSGDHGVRCGTSLLRTATINGRTFLASVFGRRMAQATKQGLPLHGIAVDDLAALEEEPYRLLDEAEKAGLGLPPETPAIRLGAEVRSLTDREALADLSARLVAAESETGPIVLALSDGNGPAARTPGTAALTSPPSWILGEKRVLWINLEFSDDPGEPVGAATVATTTAETAAFYLGTSYGKTSMVFTSLPGLLRMPRPKEFYNSAASPLNSIRDDAMAAAKAYDAANGNTGAFDPARFDRWVMAFKRVGSVGNGGFGTLGGAAV